MLGILNERLGLESTALQAFKNAFHLSASTNRDHTRINYGRLLCKLGKYTDAIAMYRDVEAATLTSGSGLALALFKGAYPV